jgi:alkylhydroperoxidase family enzyme
VLRTEFVSSEQLDAILRGNYESAGLDTAEAAVLAFAEKVALHAHRVTQEDVNHLRSHGVTDAEILDVILTAALACFVGREADATGFQLPAAFLTESRQLFGDQHYFALQTGRRYDEAG